MPIPRFKPKLRSKLRPIRPFLAARSARRAVAALTALLVPAAASAADPAPRLSLPIACEPAKTCFLQNHVDIDPGPGVRDHRCGAATYDGHKGVDFRVRNTAATQASGGVAVLAPAPGVVKGGRDGMADRLIRITGRAAVAGRECGNGVVIDHGDGWETQLCHLRRGSVTVKRGDRVARGQKLGLVGYSGMADFAHVHLSVRKGGKVVDPFTGEGPGAACRRDGAAAGMWEPAVAQAFGGTVTDVLDAGFSAAQPTTLALEQDPAALPRPDARAPVFLFYTRISNVAQGDVIAMRLVGPRGFVVDGGAKPHPKSQALALRYVGKRNTGAPWPTGTYRGEVSVTRDGREIARGAASFDLR